MRSLQFLKKEGLHSLAAPETVLLMLLFPLLITWVLGTAFSGISARTIDLPEARMPFVSDGGMAAQLYQGNSGHSGITFEPVSREEADSGLMDGSLKQYVELTDKALILHSDDPQGMEAMMVRMYSSAFIQQANLTGLALKEGRLDLAAPQFLEYTRIEGMDGRAEPSSFGYYGVTMLTMILMYGSLQMLSMLSQEKAARTSLRLKASPYAMGKVFLVKTLASCFILMVQAAIIVLFNHFVYGIEYRNIGLVLLMVVPLAVFVTSLGVLSYQVFRTENAASVFLNILTIALVFLGGGYMMVSLDDSTFAALTQFSPIGWVNQGLFQYIYRGSSAPILWAGAKLLGLGLVMYLLAFWLFKKEEGSDRVAAD